MEKLLERLKKHEGFREKVYKCTNGVDTFGYGFTNITKEEAEIILKMRVENLYKEVEEVLLNKNITLNEARKGVIVEMFFQLGKTGTLKFVKMWNALQNNNYEVAGNEMLDSNWYLQTPKRCQELSIIMKKGK